MQKIVKKEALNPMLWQLTFEAPDIAAAAKGGQYVILRSGPKEPRIPVILSDFDKSAGRISLCVRPISPSVEVLISLPEGETIHELQGPFGAPVTLPEGDRCLLVAAGMGCIDAYPILRSLKEAGKFVEVILGFRGKDRVVLENQYKLLADRLTICTPDGSYGYKGNVSQYLSALLAEDADFCSCYVMGPIVMMKFSSQQALRKGIPTTMSMNPVMMDGTGMCGGCAVKVGGEKRLACKDGPEFDASRVDFDDLLRAAGGYQDYERHDHDDRCHLFDHLRAKA